jgi:hypothetical protein
MGACPMPVRVVTLVPQDMHLRVFLLITEVNSLLLQMQPAGLQWLCEKQCYRWRTGIATWKWPDAYAR